MKCNKCGMTLPDDSTFCQYCGSKIESQIVENNSSKVEIKEETLTDEIITPVVENETAAQILASGIIEGQKAMEANKENQPHNELDTDFGIVPNKPIYTVGIDEQEKYLKSLRTINGEPIKWNRRGSMNVDGVNGMVDVYDTFLPSGEEYKTIYINMYGASNSTFAPKGFSYSNQPAISPIVPTSKHKSKKSKGLKIALIVTGIVAIVAIVCIALALSKCSHQWQEATCLKEKHCILCGEIDGVKASHSFSLGKCSGCGIFDDDYCSEHYYAIRNEMQEMDEKLGSLDFIEEKLALLPTDYKDVAQIKEDLIYIKSKYSVFSDAVFRTLMKQLMTDPTQEELEEYYVDYAKVRSSYLSLKSNANKYKNWNLSYFADNYVFDGDNNGILLAVIVGLWEDNDGNYINIVETDTNELTFGSNLPNDKDSSKSYYYFIKGNIIGYESQTDSEDTINAYRIVEIGDDYVKVFCFKNSRTYTLK